MTNHPHISFEALAFGFSFLSTFIAETLHTRQCEPLGFGTRDGKKTWTFWLIREFGKGYLGESIWESSRWVFRICFIFTPKIGEDSHFD